MKWYFKRYAVKYFVIYSKSWDKYGYNDYLFNIILILNIKCQNDTFIIPKHIFIDIDIDIN